MNDFFLPDKLIFKSLDRVDKLNFLKKKIHIYLQQ